MKIIIYIILFLLFLFWFFYNPQPYETTMIIGKKGSGKTCDIAKLSLYYQKKGYKCYSNIDIPGNYVFNPLDIDRFTFDEGSVVFIDEVGLLYDARNYKSFSQGVNEWYKYSRQYKCKVFLYSQAFNSDVDLKIRNLVDKMYLMQRIGKITLKRPIYKTMGIATDLNGNGQLVDTYRFGWVFDWKFNYMPRYYGLFKSFNPPKRELIQATYEDYNEINEIYKDLKTFVLFKIKVLFDKCKTYPKRFRSNLNRKVNAIRS